MLEVLAYFRENGYKTYIVTGGGLEFVRVYSQRVYGIPSEQVIGSYVGTKYAYANAKPELVAAQEARLKELDIPHTTIRFEGGHEIVPEMLMRLTEGATD